MLSLSPKAQTPAQPRAFGVTSVSCKVRDGQTVLDRLHQQGSMKLLFPGATRPNDGSLTGIMINTAGGITGGDRFDVSARVAPGCHMILSTQTAERAYRAQPGEVARIRNRVSVGANGRMGWLPQETLIYDHSDLHRTLEVDLEPGARLLMAEPVIFGRAEMGEVLKNISFRDSINVRSADRLLFADRTLLHGNASTRLGRAATGAGCGAMASVLLVASDAERFLEPARALMPSTGGVSPIRGGVLFARLMALDGFELRKTLVPLIELLGAGPIPKTWMI